VEQLNEQVVNLRALGSASLALGREQGLKLKPLRQVISGKSGANLPPLLTQSSILRYFEPYY
jgi:hypothetical protein